MNHLLTELYKEKVRQFIYETGENVYGISENLKNQKPDNSVVLPRSIIKGVVDVIKTSQEQSKKIDSGDSAQVSSKKSQDPFYESY